MSNITRLLNQVIIGNVFDSDRILEAYSTDRSILKMKPEMVAIPENTDDVRRIMRFVSQLKKRGTNLSVTVRGSGLDKTGADLTTDLVLSTERLNHVQEIDARSKLVRVQAGISLGKLNSALSLHGLVLPIDANPKETIGSLISNFAIDGFAGKYHGISYYIDCIEVVLASGDVLQTRNYNRNGLRRKVLDEADPESPYYNKMNDLINDSEDILNKIRERATLDASGYQMATRVERNNGKTFELAPLFYAAQGTLGVITEVILRCEALPSDIVRFAAGFESASSAVKYLGSVTPLNPLCVELYDAKIFAEAADHGKDLGLFARRYKKGYIALVAFDDGKFKAKKKLASCLEVLPESAAAIIETKENQKDFARIRTSLRSYLNDGIKGERLALADDFYVPGANLLEFLKGLPELEEKTKLNLPIFGDFMTSNYSLRPDFNLSTNTGRTNALKFLKAFTDYLEKHGGILTGGSPEGRLKALVVNQTMDPNEMEFYKKIKAIFDPDNILNPEVKLKTNVKSFVKHLRTDHLIGVTER